MKLIKSNLDNISFGKFQHWQELNLDKMQIWWISALADMVNETNKIQCGEYQLWQILTLVKMKLIKSNLDNISFGRFQHWQKLKHGKCKSGEYQLWQVSILVRMKLIKSTLDNISFGIFQFWPKLKHDEMQIWWISALANSVNANLRRVNLLKRKDDVGLSGITEWLWDREQFYKTFFKL